ncbi:MAG: heme-binding protein [Pseudomonadota bacterium]
MMQMIFLGTVAVGALAAGGAYVAATRSVETPAYSVVQKDGDIELRRYPAMTLAQVTRAGTRRSSVQSGFSPLARYIFAKDRAGEKIVMTAPVVQKPTGERWVVSFILPSGVSVEDAPKPSGDVTLVTEPARFMASIRFSGVWSDTRFDEATNRLQRWIEDKGLSIQGPFEYGYYNDPFTPAFLRQNEVLVPVIDWSEDADVEQSGT